MFNWMFSFGCEMWFAAWNQICLSENQTNNITLKVITITTQLLNFSNTESSNKNPTHSEDEADGGHARGGHDFGTVGDQVEKGRHGGLCCVVEPTAEHRRQVADDRREEQTKLNKKNIFLDLGLAFILSICTAIWAYFTLKRAALNKKGMICSLQVAGHIMGNWSLPQGDARLSHHLRAEVLGRQFERCLHEPQLLQKPVKLCCTGQKQRTHLLQLRQHDKRGRKSSSKNIFDTSQWEERIVRTSYSCHSKLPVLLIIWQHVSNLCHGLLHLPVRVDLVESRTVIKEQSKDTWEEANYK